MSFKLGSPRFNPADVLRGDKGIKNNPTNKNAPNTAPIIIKKLDYKI